MWIYIDDSGDGGFKLSKGSSSYFVLAAVLFLRPEDIQGAVELIESCAAHNRMQAPEFKYSRVRRSAADCFFECIRPARFSVRTLVVSKKVIWATSMTTDATYFKRSMHKQLLTHTFGTVSDAKVFIDGQDTGPAGFPDQGYYLRAANRARPGAVKQVRFVDSKASRPIQLADMIAGAIRRAEELGEQGHLETFRGRTFQPRGTYWKFK